MFDFENRVKPILKWAGGKSSLLPSLKEFFPKKFNRYIEPFMGSGAVYFALREGCSAIINESNNEIVNLYEVIRDEPRELMRKLDDFSKQYSETFYYKLRESIFIHSVFMAARTVFLNKTGFNGLYRMNSKGIFNVPFGKRKNCPALYLEENILRASVKLKSSLLKCEDFESVISKAGRGDFIYCDPPYDPVSKTSVFTNYTKSGFQRDAQIRLKSVCELAIDRGAMVMISNSSSDFIRELYREWDVREIKSKRSINSNPLKRGEITELCVLKGH